MPRLYRPHIPLSVKCEVAERQLAQSIVVFSFASVPERPLGLRLKGLLTALAERLGCKPEDLRLDHDPPLGARPKARRGLGKKTYYIPDANDPNHLGYRPHGPEHDGSHLIKTNVRGEHGQHPDRVLIKKQRLLEQGPKPKRGPKMRSPGFASKPGAKVRWPKRKFESRSRT